MRHFLAFADGLLWLAKWLTILIMAAMTIAVLIGVFFRFVIPIPMAWPPEAARFMMVAVTMFGSSIAIRHMEHAGITFLVDALPARLRLALYLVGAMLAAGFLAVFAYYAWRMSFQMGMVQRSSSLGVQMIAAYIAMPLGGAMMLVQLLASAIEALRRAQAGGSPFEPSSGDETPVKGSSNA